MAQLDADSDQFAKLYNRDHDPVISTIGHSGQYSDLIGVIEDNLSQSWLHMVLVL